MKIISNIIISGLTQDSWWKENQKACGVGHNRKTIFIIQINVAMKLSAPANVKD